MGSLRYHHVAVCALVTVLVAVVAVSPGLLGGRVVEAAHGLGAAEPRLLWLAGVALALMHLVGGLAWRSALAACRTHLHPVDAMARYGVGCGLNAVAPAHLGSAARLALFARAAGGDRAVWRVSGAAASVGAVRAAWLAVVVAAGASLGGVPTWPLALLGGSLALAVGVAIGSRRIRSGRRVGHLLAASRALVSQPRALGAVAIWTATGMAAKLVAATAAAASLGIDRPFLAALVLVPAVELAAVMPLTPGNAGVSSAAAALALGAVGADARTALSVGLAFGALELLAGVAVGLAGALALSSGALRPAIRLAAAGTAVSLACMAVVVTTAV